MNCGITVFDHIVAVRNPSTNEITELEVIGYSQSAAQVVVSFKQGAEAWQESGPIDASSGIWKATFDPALNYRCWELRSDLQVEVRAEPEGECDRVQKSDEFRVVCRTSRGCPTPDTDIAVEVDPFCHDGVRNVTVRIRYDFEDGASGIFSLDNGENSEEVFQDANGVFEHRFLDVPAGVYVAKFVHVGDYGCDRGVKFTVEPCECSSTITLEVVDSADTVVIQVDAAGVATGVACVPPGTYKVRARLLPIQILPYSWYLDESNTEEAQHENWLGGIEVDDVTTRTVEVVVTPPSCPAVRNRVVLEPCRPRLDCMPYQIEVRQSTPDNTGRLLYTISGPNSDPVTEPMCLPAGKYDLIVVSPREPRTTYLWSDGVRPLDDPANPTGPVFSGFDLKADHSTDNKPSVLIGIAPDGRCWDVDVPIRVCECADDLQIKIFKLTADGEREIGPEECVSPGAYQARVEPSNTADAQYEWTRNGRRPQSGGSQYNFDLKSTWRCFGVGSSHVIEVTARNGSNPDACPEKKKDRRIDLCEEWVFCIPCWLLRLLIIGLAGMVVTGFIFFLCPGIGDQTLIRHAAEQVQDEYSKSILLEVWAAILAVWEVVRVVVVVVAAIAAFVLAGCTILYIWKCKPRWCFDWFVLLWQMLLHVGYLFFYYGTCETCVPFGVIGAGLLFAGVVVLFLWVIFCKPKACRILAEFASVGAINMVALMGLVTWVLGPCVWHYGFLIKDLWNFIFFIAGIAAAFCFVLDPEHNMTASPEGD
jgi:hypothetical protein